MADSNKLLAMKTEAKRRYRAYDFSPTWVTRVEKVVRECWPRADMRTAKILVEIMANTPSTRWIWDYILPAERGEIHNATLLIANDERISSAAAEGECIADGFSRPAASWFEGEGADPVEPTPPA